MIAQLLSTQYVVHKTMGNFNHIGLPLSVLSLTRNHTGGFEMGMSGPVDRVPVRHYSSGLGVITNIGISHIENWAQGRISSGRSLK